MNYDGTTGAGDTFLTVDMVCADCHQNMTQAQMARYAKYVHRQPGLVDLTVNGSDSQVSVTKNQYVSVNFATFPDDRTGMAADWYVLSQGPTGWKYFDGKKWKSGYKVWKKKAALSEMAAQVQYSKLTTTGSYTYWVQIYPTDGSEHVDSVPVYVRRK